MRRTADKIAHLRKTGFEHSPRIDALLPRAGKERFERGK
jgi:hypothetical protein